MSEWQSIDTAPKDGTFILLYADGDTAIVYWDDNQEMWMSPEDNLGAHIGFRNPTHWMPEPEPPKDTP